MRSTFTATAALALVPLAFATGVRPLLPVCEDNYKNFVAKGCYADADSTALVQRSLLDQYHMTVETCTSECKSNGFRYAGLRAQGICFCGNSIDGDKVADDKCFQACSGDNSEVCGSDETLSVWEDPTFLSTPDEVTVGDYQNLGCHTDESEDGRALAFRQNLAADTFTPDVCVDACRSLGYAFAGVEFGSECWCGTYLPDDTNKVDKSECDKPCGGDDLLMCGGGERINIYYAEDLVSSEPCGFVVPALPGTTTTSTTSCTTTSTSSYTTTSTTSCTTTSTASAAITQRPTTTTTAAMCTSTAVKPAKCEWQCGSWCAPALPEWTTPTECLGAAKSCALQVASCFKSAGWPGALQCFDFANWCSDIKEYCSADCRGDRCNKSDCFARRHPNGGNAPATTTSVFPCAATTTMATATRPATTSTSCPPQPTNICTQPKNDRYGYAPGKPVGGIELAVVGCNDIQSDFSRNPFKFYTHQDSRRCSSFDSHSLPSVCADACEAQYNDCKATYVKSCENTSWRADLKLSVSASVGHRRSDDGADDAEGTTEIDRRTFGWGGLSSWVKAGASIGWGNSHHGSASSDDFSHCAASDHTREWCRDGADDVQCWGRGGNDKSSSLARCKAQYKDCLSVNKRVDSGASCQKFCDN